MGRAEERADWTALVRAVDADRRSGDNRIEFADKLVLAYCLYNAISVIWLIKSGMPYAVYLWEFAVSLLPMILYYIGRKYGNSPVLRKKNFLFYRYFLYAVIIAGVVVAFCCGFAAIPPASISERSEKWIAAVNNMYSTWLGNGLGANGYKAIGLEDAHPVIDNALVKMYCEQGIIGFSMFIYIIILSFKKGLVKIRENGAELVFMAAALLLSSVFGVTAFQLTAPVFWFAAGRIQGS